MNQIMFNELQTRQFLLDEMIRREKGLDGILVRDKIVSLDVELCEFANEVRFFKYWSNKGMDREKALTEYVDGLHFFLSIANDLGIDNLISNENINSTDHEMKDIYMKCKQRVVHLYRNRYPRQIWHIAFAWFMAMGEKVGFTIEEVYNEYLNKNQVNKDRQKSGY